MLKTIVVATDFSERSELAVKHALEMAEKFGSEVVFVNGIEGISGLQEEESAELSEFYDRLRARADRKMAAQIAQAEKRGVTARSHVAVGARWQVILECAEQENADLIVIGRRSYADQSSVPVGTTSQRVYFASNRPVMMVPVLSMVPAVAVAAV